MSIPGICRRAIRIYTWAAGTADGANLRVAARRDRASL